MTCMIKIQLSDVINQLEQAAREIYYAATFLESGHPARANLKLALEALGVTKPSDVGLSDSVLREPKAPKLRGER